MNARDMVAQFHEEIHFPDGVMAAGDIRIEGIRIPVSRNLAFGGSQPLHLEIPAGKRDVFERLIEDERQLRIFHGEPCEHGSWVSWEGCRVAVVRGLDGRYPTAVVYFDRARWSTRTVGVFSASEHSLYSLSSTWAGPTKPELPTGLPTPADPLVMSVGDLELKIGATLHRKDSPLGLCAVYRPAIVFEAAAAHAQKMNDIASDIALVLGLALRENVYVTSTRRVREMPGSFSSETVEDFQIARYRKPEWPLVMPALLGEFMPVAVAGVRALEEEKRQKLREAMLFVAGHWDASTVQAQFTDLMVALETLLAPRYKQHRPLSNGQLERLKKVVSEHLERDVVDTLTRELVFGKVGEFQRAPLSFVLDRLYEDLDVRIDDLGSRNTEGGWSFVIWRNRVFHGRGFPEGRRTFKEVLRLRYLLERIILRMLGWTAAQRTWRTAADEGWPLESDRRLMCERDA